MLLSAEQVTKLYGDRILLDRVSQESPRFCACWREQKSRTAEQSSGNQTYAWSI